MNHEQSENDSKKLLEYKLGQMEMHLGRLDEKMDKLTEDWNMKFERLFSLLHSSPKCPKPGACLPLEVKTDLMEKQVAELFKRVHDLEDARQFTAGLGRGAIILLTLLGGLLGSIIMYVITKFFA